MTWKKCKIFLLAIACIVLVNGCGPKKDAPFSTGQIISKIDLCNLFGASYTILRNVYAGDSHYAVVNSKYLPEFYDEFRKELFDKGVVKWDERFDCNHFASYYISLAQVKFYAKSWNSNTKAQTLAMGIYWYTKDNNQGNHAIVVILTENGLVYLEPQTGKMVKLTESEKNSSFLKVF